MSPWLIWICAGIACVILEIFTTGFLLLSFGMGAIIAGLVAKIFPDSWALQLFSFSIATFIIFINIRKFSKKVSSKPKVESNVYALIGKTGRVTKDILPQSKGYVKIGGEEWAAIAQFGTEYTVGTEVIVTKIEGNKVIVTTEEVKS